MTDRPAIMAQVAEAVLTPPVWLTKASKRRRIRRLLRALGFRVRRLDVPIEAFGPVVVDPRVPPDRIGVVANGHIGAAVVNIGKAAKALDTVRRHAPPFPGHNKPLIP